MSSLSDRFRTYPPALQWLFIGMVAVLGFLLWYEYAWGTSIRWNERAGEYEMAIAEAETETNRLSANTANAIRTIGEVEPLGTRAEGAATLSAAINEVLTRYNAKGPEVKEKTPIKFKPNEVGSLAPGSQVEKLLTEVRFEASQDDVFNIIADLEHHPKIETVNKVRIAKPANTANKTLIVQLTVEAWIVGGASRTGAAGRRAGR